MNVDLVIIGGGPAGMAVKYRALPPLYESTCTLAFYFKNT